VLLWNDPFCKTICFQYQTTVLPVLFYAAVHGLMQLQKASELHAVVGCAMVSTVKSARGWSRAGSIALFTASIAACAFLGLHAFSKFNLPYVFRIETSRLPALERIVGGIPPGASVLASHRAAAHLLNDYEVSIVADEIRSDFVLIDLKDSWGDVAGLEKLRKRVEESRAYAPVDSGDGIFLYQRISPGTSSVLP
jgi:uncharacterized membrane protein